MAAALRVECFIGRRPAAVSEPMKGVGLTRFDGHPRSGQANKVANSGQYKYEFPSVIAGIDIPVSGFHSESGINCSGAVIVRIDGGGIKNPAAIVALVLTAISGTLLIVSARPRGVAR